MDEGRGKREGKGGGEEGGRGERECVLARAMGPQWREGKEEEGEEEGHSAVQGGRNETCWRG